MAPNSVRRAHHWPCANHPKFFACAFLHLEELKVDIERLWLVLGFLVGLGVNCKQSVNDVWVIEYEIVPMY